MSNFVETREEKIEDLNLIALRKYACAKVSNSKDWYLKCVECQGVDDCSCGRRVRDILEGMTKPAEKPGKYDRLEDKNEVFLTAWKTGDPLHYLVDHGHYKTIGSAGNSLSKWVKKTGLVSKEEYQEYCSRTLRESGLKAGEKMAERARQTVCDIFEGTTTDDEKRLAILRATSSDNTVKAIYNKVMHWAKQYEDLEQKYRFVDACKIFGTRDNAHKTVGEFLAKIHSNGDTDGDEISLDAFLNEMDPQVGIVSNEQTKKLQDSKADAVFTPTLGDKLDEEAKKAHIELVPASSAQLVLQQEFGKKRIAFREKIEALGKDISDLVGKRNKLMDQMKLLDATAEMFGLKPVNH